MRFAPLAFLRRTPPRRTLTAHSNPVTSPDIGGDDSFSIAFTAPPVPEGKPSSIQSFPPSLGGRSSLFTPPPHYHLIQDEHFHVLSGTGTWHLRDGEEVYVKAGGTISVPTRQYHWFESAVGSDESLVVGYWYDREYTEMEEKFFRNTLGYLADCIRAGQQPSFIQFAVFSVRNWMVLGVVDWKFAPHWLNFVANTIITFTTAAWGVFVLGYDASYGEYYRPRRKSD